MLLTERVKFHTAAYGIAINEHSPAFGRTMGRLQHLSQHATGAVQSQSALHGKILIMRHLMKQAFVTAVNDDFLIAGAITILCLVPIYFLRRAKTKVATAVAEYRR
jgi:MFS transporter, DHA2 family, multidrug resistance protein